MKRMLSIQMAVLLAAGLAAAQTNDTPAEIDSPGDISALRRANDAQVLLQAATESRQAYDIAVNSGPAVDAVSLEIGRVTRDLQTAMRTRKAKAKQALDAATPELEGVQAAEATYAAALQSPSASDQEVAAAKADLRAARHAQYDQALDQPEIVALDATIEQLKTELRDLIQQRRVAVRANRAAMTEQKAAADAAEQSYRDHVYDELELASPIAEP